MRLLVVNGGEPPRFQHGGHRATVLAGNDKERLILQQRIDYRPAFGFDQGDPDIWGLLEAPEMKGSV